MVAFSIAEMVLLGLLAEWIFQKLRLPGLLGMLVLGVICGPYGLQLMGPDFLHISSDLRMIALIIILLRAGLELSFTTLRKVGAQAALMSFIPSLLEGTTIALIGPHILPLNHLESAMLGFIIASVSPAVVVPMMVQFIEQRRGEKKGIPTMILAAASLDDVFAIIIFSMLLGFYTESSSNIALKLAGIPLSILLGIGIGLLLGFILLKFFQAFKPRATKQTLIIIGISILLIHFEKIANHINIPFSALLAIMASGFIILEKREHTAHMISSKLGKLWIFASIMLFTLIGAQVDISLVWKTGAAGLGLIICGLTARSMGVLLSLIHSPLTWGERFFSVVSYWPKATVQAAFGAVPLGAMIANDMDTEPGRIILAVAVTSIAFTAPIGALAIKWMGERVLHTNTAHNTTPALNAAKESQ